MGTEEGPTTEDDNGQRWKLTVRGLKWRRRSRFNNGAEATPTVEADKRQSSEMLGHAGFLHGEGWCMGRNSKKGGGTGAI
jgi:hypothetical protein